MSEQEKPYRYVAKLAELMPEVPADSIISRIVKKDKNVNITLFGFAAGQELSEHTAARPAVLYFLSGEAEVGLGGDVVAAEAGSWIEMEAHLTHAIRAKTEVMMLLLLH